jgi:DNA polymerase-3 subunit beta
MNATTPFAKADISFAQGDLKAALKVLSKAVMKYPVAPILSTILIEKPAGATTATLTTSDLDLTITRSVEVGGNTAAFKAAIRLATLKAIAEHATAPIGISREDKALTITSDLVTTRIRDVWQVEDFPTRPKLNPDESKAITMAEGDMARLIKLSKFCISKDETRYYLNGIYLHPHPDTATLRAVTTDGHRMAVIDTEHDAGDMASVILPKDAVPALEILCRTSGNQQITLTVSPEHVSLQHDVTTITTKLIDGTYPNYPRVIPDIPENPNSATLNKSTITRLFEIANASTPFMSMGLSLDPSAGRIQISTACSDDRSEVSAPLSGQGSDKIGFNARYVLDQLKVTQTAHFEWGSGSDPTLITSEDPDAFWILMPQRT